MKTDGIPSRLQAKVEVDDGGKFRVLVNDWSLDHNDGLEDNAYIYHSDYLSSAIWKKGTFWECFASERGEEPRSRIPSFAQSSVSVQYLQHLPFGEPLVNHRT